MQSIENIQWSSENYRDVNVIAELAGKELGERLSWMNLQPKRILDIACGLSTSPDFLAKRYPLSNVIKLDKHMSMLVTNPAFHLIHSLQADGKHLPLKSESIDLIFANLLLPWQTSLESLFKEWRRVISTEGLLLFSAFGPDTLKDWQSVFQADDFILLRDMHDIGDLLLALGFIDPVVDVEYVTVSYSNYEKLCYELIATGVWFPDQPTYQKLIQHQTELPSLDIHYEIIYGHAFAPLHQQKNSEQFSIPLSTLREQLKNR